MMSVRIRRWSILLVAIIAAGAIVRIAVFDIDAASAYGVDVARDYLFASHILSHHDFPLTGPDGYFGPHSNSPFYFYLLAALLAICNSILFPGLVNVVLQIASLPLVYYIASALFGKKTALLSTFFFAFFDPLVMQAALMWQPHLMLFVLLLSIALLMRYRQRAEPGFLFGSVASFALAIVIHNSAFAIAPIFAFCVFISARSKEYSENRLRLSAAIFGGVILIAFSSVAYYALTIKPHIAPLSKTEALYTAPPLRYPSFTETVKNSVTRTERFSSFFFAGEPDVLKPWGTFMLAFMLFASSAYLFFERDRRKVYTVLLLLCACGLIIGSMSAIPLQTDSDFPVRYYTPLYPVLLMLLAEYLCFLVRSKIALIAIACIIVGVAAQQGFAALAHFPTQIDKLLTRGIAYQYVDGDALSAILNTVHAESSGDDLVPFDVLTFERDTQQLTKSELVWIGLEHLLGMQLTRIDYRAMRGYGPLYDPTLVFIRCIKLESGTCASLFEKKYGQLFSVRAIVYQSTEDTYLYAKRIK